MSKTVGTATYWFTYRSSADADWHVVLSTPDECPWLENAEGVTLPQKHLVVLDRRAPVDRLPVVLLHELMHAELSAPGDGTTLGHILSCEPDAVPELEEALVSYLAPKITSALTRNGFLRLPKVPKLAPQKTSDTAGHPRTKSRPKGAKPSAKGRACVLS